MPIQKRSINISNTPETPSGDSSPEKLGARRDRGSGDGVPGNISKPRPLDLRETPFFIIEIGPF